MYGTPPERVASFRTVLMHGKGEKGCWLALEHRLINEKCGSDIGHGVDKD